MNEDDVKENIPRFIWRGKIDVTQLQTPLWYPSTDTLRKWDYLKKKNHTFLIVTNLNTHTRTLIRHLLNVKEMTTFLLGNGITLSKTDLAPQSQGNEKKNYSTKYQMAK